MDKETIDDGIWAHTQVENYIEFRRAGKIGRLT